MVMTSRGAVETNGRDGGGSDGRGDHLRWVLCGSREGVLGAQNGHWERGTFFSVSYPFRTHEIPMSDEAEKVAKTN